VLPAVKSRNSWAARRFAAPRARVPSYVTRLRFSKRRFSKRRFSERRFSTLIHTLNAPSQQRCARNNVPHFGSIGRVQARQQESPSSAESSPRSRCLVHTLSGREGKVRVPSRGPSSLRKALGAEMIDRPGSRGSLEPEPEATGAELMFRKSRSAPAVEGRGKEEGMLRRWRRATVASH
jgi:hypothetical protein